MYQHEQYDNIPLHHRYLIRHPDLSHANRQKIVNDCKLILKDPILQRHAESQSGKQLKQQAVNTHHREAHHDHIVHYYEQRHTEVHHLTTLMHLDYSQNSQYTTTKRDDTDSEQNDQYS